jgi:hypothetical protein
MESNFFSYDYRPDLSKVYDAVPPSMHKALTIACVPMRGWNIISSRQPMQWMGFSVPFYSAPPPIWSPQVIEYHEANDSEESAEWRRTEVLRCKYGIWSPKGELIMTPDEYFYLTYFYMKSAQKAGAPRPEFRQCDELWFRALRGAEAMCRGLAVVKRRRWGFSWKTVSATLRRALFSKYKHLGMSSENESKSNDLIRMVNHSYNKLPAFLKIGAGTWTKSKIEFTIKQTKGRKGKIASSGNGTIIEAKSAASEKVWESTGMKMITFDESGKYEGIDLPTLLTNTIPCLAGDNGITRTGCLIVGGTVGDMDKSGAQMESVYNDAHVYDMDRFFVPGWMGLVVDKFGNDNRDAAEKLIAQEMEKVKNDYKALIQKRQQYPMTIEDAFAIHSDSVIFDMTRVNAQLAELAKNPPPIVNGNLVRNDAMVVSFSPSDNGKIRILERPVESIKNIPYGYIIGVDPYDHNVDMKANGQHSKGACMVFKRTAEVGELAYLPVATYMDRCHTDEFYTNCWMLAVYYNAKMAVESNRAGMINWMEAKGPEYFKYVEWFPTGLHKVTADKTYRPGIATVTENKHWATELMIKYVDDHCDKIFFSEILKEYAIFGKKNTDMLMAKAMVMLFDNYLTSKSVKRAQFQDTSRFRPTLPKARLSSDGQSIIPYYERR